MADTALKLVLLGADKSASSTLRGVQGEAKKTGGVLGKVGGVGKMAMLGVAGAALAAIPAVVDFGKESLAAFADAEKSQRQLEDAYKRFPKVASVNIETIREYNQAIQRKTGADADDIASGQAVLARYKLTGAQLKEMTPLLVDYANRTGKSIPDAAKAMGKSLGGAGKLAKELGFEFRASKDPADNYRQTMEGLRKTVGGYTDKMPEAEKKQAILAASFGDLQENVGEKLQPALMGLVDAGQSVLDWMTETPEVGQAANAMWDGMGMVLQGLGWVLRKVLVPALLIFPKLLSGIIWGLSGMLDALGNVPGFGWAKDAARSLGTYKGAIDKVVSATERMIADPPVVDVRVEGAKRKISDIDRKIRDLRKQRAIEIKTNGNTAGVREIDRKIAALKRQRHRVNVGVGLVPSGRQSFRVIQTKAGGTVGGRMRYVASGTPYAPSGGLTWVGEAGPELMQLPTGSRVLSNGQSRALAGRSSSSGGGGDTVNIIAPPGAPRAFALLIEDELVKLKQSRGRGGKLRF